MELLLPIAVFIGLPLGILLGYIAKEELKQGKSYIELFRKILLFSIVVLALLSLFFYVGRTLAIIEIAIGVIAVLLLEKVKTRLDYLLLGLMMAGALLAFESWYLLLFSAMVFMYGLPYGSQLLETMKKLKWKPMLYHALMFFLPFILLLLGKWGTLFIGISAVCLLFRFRN